MTTPRLTLFQGIPTVVVDAALPLAHWLHSGWDQLAPLITSKTGLDWTLHAKTHVHQVSVVNTGRSAFEEAVIQLTDYQPANQFGLNLAAPSLPEQPRDLQNQPMISLALGHLVMGIDRAALAPLPDITDTQSSVFWQAIQPALADHGLHWVGQTQEFGWVQADWLAQLAIPSIQAAQDRDSEAFHQQSPLQLQLSKFVTQAQMLMFSSPACMAENEGRQDDGFAPINTVIPRGQASTNPVVLALTPALEDASVAQHASLTIDSRLRTIWPHDPLSWAGQWQRMHDELIAPISMRKQAFDLVLCAHQVALHVQVRPSLRLKFWEKPNLRHVFEQAASSLG